MTTLIKPSPLDKFYPKNLGEFIVPKNNLLADVKKSKAVELIVNEVKRIPDYEKYQTDLEFLKMVCNFAENMIVKKDGINKLDIVIRVFHNLFGLEIDLVKLKGSIEFLLNNHRITKIPFVKKALFFLNKTVKKLL